MPLPVEAETMRRRTFLAATAGTVTVWGAGCGVLGADDSWLPPALEDPPDGVYRPTSASEVRVVGTREAGDYRFGLLYSYPSRFWEVVGRQRYPRSVAPEDAIHLMTLVWDPETGVVLPDVGLTVEVLRDGELVVQKAVYAMLSQRLGFHYGDNLALPGDGEYTVRVRVGGLAIRRTGAFAGRFDGAASVDFELAYDREERDSIDRRRLDDAGDDRPLTTADAPGVPPAVAPATDALPARHLGRRTTDGAALDAVVCTGDAVERLGVDGDAYLAVLARTPHNDLVLPGMGLQARVERADETAFDGTLSRTVDPLLGAHYGTPVPELTSGDRVTLTVLTPPQVARHEGYETVFFEMEPVTMAVP
ncbi:iron transporter [Haloarchaeobius sp. FL176]|uniref:iron transporter n=1 Tax=Haloarchaeobius sp. FL176 TaxID=2967129 RepID=UPI002148E76A|nr:iron transporter [Haloarchaeobius sp. FL176]